MQPCAWDAAAFGGSIDVNAILDFVDSGHDLILAADVGASDTIRDIALECGVDFDEVRHCGPSTGGKRLTQETLIILVSVLIRIITRECGVDID